jgi:hypothetical protein
LPPGVLPLFFDDFESGVVLRSLPFLLLPGVACELPLMAPVGRSVLLEPEEEEAIPPEELDGSLATEAVPIIKPAAASMAQVVLVDGIETSSLIGSMIGLNPLKPMRKLETVSKCPEAGSVKR